MLRTCEAAQNSSESIRRTTSPGVFRPVRVREFDPITLVRRSRPTGGEASEKIAEFARFDATINLLWEGNRVSTIVEEKVIGIVSEQLGVPKEEVKLDSSIIEDLKADSLDVVELVMQFEEAFDLEIPDEDAEKIKTVKDAVEYIEKNSKGGK